MIAPMPVLSLGSQPPCAACGPSVVTPSIRMTPMSRRFSPGARWWLLYAMYRAGWWLMLPVAIALLWMRGRRQPGYRKNWGERFGGVPPRADRPVWVHAASLGEIRGAAPLLRALCGQGLPVRLTTLTPAGRDAARSLCPEDHAAGRLEVVYAPVEWAACVRRFLQRTRPRYTIVMENDLWPVMLVEAHRTGLPLCMANAQYSERSLQRDQRMLGFRSRLFGIYDLVIAKSSRQAERFATLGVARVEVGGETRFDLPAPQAQLDAAALVAHAWGLGTGSRSVFTVASAVQGEEERWLSLLSELRSRHAAAGRAAPLFVVVPRNPARFDAWDELLRSRGWKVARRSEVLDRDLHPRRKTLDRHPSSGAPPGAGRLPTDPPSGSGSAPQPDDGAEVLIGDSLGEMFFYLALADAVAVGGSFLPAGSHNVIEPLSLGKPVVVGPVTWTIEFPAEEALAAGVLLRVDEPAEMVEPLMRWLGAHGDAAAIGTAASDFARQHMGATRRHLQCLQDGWLDR